MFLLLLYSEVSFGGTGGARRFLLHRRKKNRPIMLTARIPAMAEPMAMPIAAPVLTPSVLVSICPPGGCVWIGTGNVATVVESTAPVDLVTGEDEVCCGTLSNPTGESVD